MASLRAKDGKIRLVYWDKILKKNRETSLGLNDDPQGWKIAKRELKKFNAEAELGLNKPEPVKRSVSLSGARDYYLDFKTTGDDTVSKKTIEAVKYATEKIISCLGDIDLGSLDKKKFDYFIEWMKNKKLEKNSRRLITAHLLAAYNLCRRDGLVENYYFYSTKREEKPPRAIQAGDLKDILGTLKAVNPDAYYLINFMLLTGFRKNSALAMTWDVIDLEKRQISVPNIKGKRNSDLFPVSKDLLALLQNIPRIEKNNRLFIYTNVRLNFWERLYATINKNREKKNEEIERCGGGEKDKWPTMPHYTIHQIRKTFLSNLINKGFRFEEVAYLAGHKDIRTTRKYYLEFDISRLRDKLDTF